VDNYHPDLLYSDGGVPFGNQAGLSMIAHLYNSSAARHPGHPLLQSPKALGDSLHDPSAARHGGQVEVVYNCKQKSDGRWVEDLERGIMPKIDPYPWQTDTSIGDWFYDRNWKFRPVSWVINMLVDNVSKNGNLLLNIVQRPDGSLDPEVEEMLKQLAKWNAIYGQAIYGTRPWFVYGESAVKVKGGAFGEDYKYNAREIRFTTKGATLYAIALGWPADGKLVVRSLAAPAGKIKKVSLLGYKPKVGWQQTDEGLVVTLPDQKVSEYTCAVRIEGTGLKPVQLPQLTTVIRAEPNGSYLLGADAADLHGDQIKQEAQGGQPNIGFWDKANEWVSWKVNFEKPGAYKVSASTATVNGDIEFAVEAAGQQLTGTAPQTGGWSAFRETDIGQIKIEQPGDQTIKVRPKDAATWKAINLRSIKLTPAP
jgi:alpha-L-fucosidase